jgi:hypothetical protein
LRKLGRTQNDEPLLQAATIDGGIYFVGRLAKVPLLTSTLAAR